MPYFRLDALACATIAKAGEFTAQERGMSLDALPKLDFKDPTRSEELLRKPARLNVPVSQASL